MSEKKVLGYVITMFNERSGMDIECRGATIEEAKAEVMDISLNGKWSDGDNGEEWYYSPLRIVSFKIRKVTEEDAWSKK